MLVKIVVCFLSYLLSELLVLLLRFIWVSASIWHLADVLAWFDYSLTKDVLDVARVAVPVNVTKEGRRLPRSVPDEQEALVG